MQKLPRITIAFWFLKILATTLGETGGDWLSTTMGLGYLTSSLVFFGALLVLCAAQLAVDSLHPFLYWSAIVATSTAGTTLSDYMDRTLGLGYTKGAAILVAILLSLLSVWRLTVGNVRVDAIRSSKAEAFYWLTILFSNTLGTAAGDFLADDSGLGFLGGWLLVTGLLLVIAALASFTRMSRVALFWTAFVLTRPFGATLGDVLTKAREQGGLDLGTAHSSLVLLSLLLLGILTMNKKNPILPEQ